MHLVGLAAALPACLLLLSAPPDAETAVALATYAVGLIVMLACSALYNSAAPGRRREIFRRLDHAAIFVMIAGTYTPITVLALEGGSALLAVVWIGAACGAALKLLDAARFERATVLAYLALGWVGAAMVHQLIEAIPGWSLALLILGGVIYSLGVLLHLRTRLRYHAALWHGCVVAAAGCHYAVILELVLSPPG